MGIALLKYILVAIAENYKYVIPVKAKWGFSGHAMDLRKPIPVSTMKNVLACLERTLNYDTMCLICGVAAQCHRLPGAGQAIGSFNEQKKGRKV